MLKVRVNCREIHAKISFDHGVFEEEDFPIV